MRFAPTMYFYSVKYKHPPRSFQCLMLLLTKLDVSRRVARAYLPVGINIT